MKTITFIMATLIGLVAFAGNTVLAQEIKGGQRMMLGTKTTENVTTTEQTAEFTHVKNKEPKRRSAVADGGHSTVNFALKSRGYVGPYEIAVHRERGLFGPSTVETFIFDQRTGELSIVNPSSSPGVGIAIVNGGAVVGASYVFGHSIRPDQTTVQNGSTASAGGSTSSATGGAGGTGGTASATGGTATGGTANATGGTANNTVSGGLGGTSQTVNVNSGSANGNGVINVGPTPHP